MGERDGCLYGELNLSAGESEIVSLIFHLFNYGPATELFCCRNQAYEFLSSWEHAPPV